MSARHTGWQIVVFDESLFITYGTVFAISSHSGDFHRHTTEGFYAHDTRFLSRFRLNIEGHEPIPAGASTLTHYIASFYATSRGTRNLPTWAISIVRERLLENGLH